MMFLAEGWLRSFFIFWFVWQTTLQTVTGKIDRRSVIANCNPQRNGSNYPTPMQVGNGNLGFSVDVTGLQTLQPFNTLSSWGWHNSSLPSTPGQSRVEDFTGLQWWTHGRLVTYNQPNPAEKEISQWLIANPHRINLIRIGFQFQGQPISEDGVTKVSQTLDLYAGIISSTFTLNGTEVAVKTAVHPTSDSIAVEVSSALLETGQLGVFLDYPYASGKNKFDAPYVGIWNATANHTTSAKVQERMVIIQHDLDATTYFTAIQWEGNVTILPPANSSHRYSLSVSGSSSLTFSATLSPYASEQHIECKDILNASAEWWEAFWNTGAFVSLRSNGIDSDYTAASELQRRVILSQYLTTINGASKDNPPQESGLTNNGWYGKFHLEMIFWHSLHFLLWRKGELFDRHSNVYQRFLQSSIQRAREMGYAGARWGKMSDPSGRSAPGEINSLLIWQQPHPMYFAELEYQQNPTIETLEKWNDVLRYCADFMVSYAWYNASTEVYDLGPPMHLSSENTNPNTTINPAFEISYWHFGLTIAEQWFTRQNLTVNPNWTTVRSSLPPLPTDPSTNIYIAYEGVPNPWTDPDLISDHPSMSMLYGLLPTDSIASFNRTTFTNTMFRIHSSWNLTNCFGWDFPLLAIASARLNDTEKALEMLLHEEYRFDDVGMPVGGVRVTTPYFPASGGLLTAVALMAGGWQGVGGVKWPEGWAVEAEGFQEMWF